MPAVAANPWKLIAGLLVDERLSALGLRHGVTTRALGDMKEQSAQARALAAAGAAAPLALLRQVHGALIHRAEQARDGRRLEGDGWLLAGGGVTAGVFVADCMPIFLAHRSGRFAGVFHSGWRGTASGMPRRAVAALCGGFSVPPSELVASIGPHIGPCCYGVGDDVAARFPESSLRRQGPRARLDLGAEARRQLVEAGLPGSAIAEYSECTRCREDLFFSFRRDKRDCRMLGLAAVEERA